MRSIEEIEADMDFCTEALSQPDMREEQAESFEYRLKSDEKEIRLLFTDEIPLDRLKEICDAERDGRCEVMTKELALAMRAGAFAIEQNKRCVCTSYVYDVFGENKEISFYSAAVLLRTEAEKALKEREE